MKTLLIFFLILFFISSNHPLIMIFHLIAITIFLSLLSSTILSTSWFSYILILIILGAMLIIFLYMTSFAPNEMMTKNWKTMMTLFLLIPILCFHPSLMKTNLTMSTLLYNQSPYLLTILTATYLMITMIAIVKISSLHHGPMKSN